MSQKQKKKQETTEEQEADESQRDVLCGSEEQEDSMEEEQDDEYQDKDVEVEEEEEEDRGTEKKKVRKNKKSSEKRVNSKTLSKKTMRTAMKMPKTSNVVLRKQKKTKTKAKKEKRVAGYNTLIKKPKASLSTEEEIVVQQHTTKTVIPKSPFFRLLKEIVAELSSGSSIYSTLRFRKSAVEALLESSEDHLREVFALTDKLCKHANRKTIKKEDLLMAVDINQ